MIIKDLYEYRRRDIPIIYSNYHKTATDDYQAGDLFLGITVPNTRIVAKKHYKQATYLEITNLLENPIHEYRLCALMILVFQMKKADLIKQKEIVDYYLQHSKQINSWDLVDLSAPYILGIHLLNTKNYHIAYGLAKSKDLWEKRISIVATWVLIRERIFEVTLSNVKTLLEDSHDLIHKAMGWMLREIGKKDINVLNQFIEENYHQLPRTTLRYAIEKYDEASRKQLLKGEFPWNKQ